MNPFISIMVDVIDKVMSKVTPGISGYVHEAAGVVFPIVLAVEEEMTDHPGPEKKAAAVKALLDEMALHNIGDGKKFDLPGKLEEIIASWLVEAAVTFMKTKGADFFAGAAKLLK